VIYMGLRELPNLCRELVRHGLPPDWPAALVEQGTSERQRVVSGSLSTLPVQARSLGLQSPTLLIVGEVVKLRERLEWFDGAAQNAPVDREAI